MTTMKRAAIPAVIALALAVLPVSLGSQHVAHASSGSQHVAHASSGSQHVADAGGADGAGTVRPLGCGGQFNFINPATGNYYYENGSGNVAIPFKFDWGMQCDSFVTFTLFLSHNDTSHYNSAGSYTCYFNCNYGQNEIDHTFSGSRDKGTWYFYLDDGSTHTDTHYIYIY